MYAAIAGAGSPFEAVGLGEAEQRRREGRRPDERPLEGVDRGQRLLLVEQHVGRPGDRGDAARLQLERLVVQLLRLGRLTVLDRAVRLGDQVLVAPRMRVPTGGELVGRGRDGAGSSAGALATGGRRAAGAAGRAPQARAPQRQARGGGRRPAAVKQGRAPTARPARLGRAPARSPPAARAAAGLGGDAGPIPGR